MSFKTILVAGASRGIGLAVAEHLASQSDRMKRGFSHCGTDG